MSIKSIANFGLFQLGWLIAVIGAARGYPLAGVVYALAWALLHHWSIRVGRRQELLLVAAGAGLGFAVDSLLVLNGMITFPEQAWIGYPSTVWMVCLWSMFAMTLRHSLRWLHNQFLLAAFLGALCGPLAYWAGSRIGAIHLSEGTVSIAAIAMAWAGSMVCLLYLELWTRSVRLDLRDES